MSVKGSRLKKGGVISFQNYLSECRNPEEGATHWTNQLICEMLSLSDGTSRGSLSLVNSDRRVPGEAAPGISMSIQEIKPNQATTAHSHSFWHLYTVFNGNGLLGIADCELTPLSKGDVIYIPAWQIHHFVNRNQSSALQLYVIQNLPAQVEMGSLMRGDADKVIHVYANG